MTWILTCLSIIGVVLNVRKDRRGFIFWIIANSGWMVIDFVYELYAQAFLFLVYLILALWGWVSWKK